MVEVGVSVAEEIWIPSYKGYKAFDSRRSTLEDVLSALSNPDVNIVGIYGAGGIGKTTLARAVAQHAEDKLQKFYFDVVVFAELSTVPDIRKIQGDIADKLGLTFKEDGIITGRARKLQNVLKQEEQNKKILLVLDNLRGKLELDEVGIPFEDDSKGCKVLLTARDLDVLTAMDSRHNFSMDLLNDQEAWNLFKTTAGSCIEQSDDLQVLAKDVAKACGGLPIAIVTIASALKNKEEFEWKNALTKLTTSSSNYFEGVAAKTYSCIEISYNQLKEEELKSTFLLCCTIGHTSIEILLKYAMGLGVFNDIKMVHATRNRVKTLLQQLKSSSLLHDANEERISMHDVVRDVGRSIAFRDQHIFTVTDDDVRWWDDEDTLKTFFGISLHNVSELPKELKCSCLQFLYIKAKNDEMKIPNDFFIGMSKLRVLHLVGFNLSSLPTSLCLLRNLRTLCMEECEEVQDTAVIGELKKLEILSINYVFIEYLPTKICELTALRLLDLRKCPALVVIPPNFIAGLTQLEELYLGDSHIQWEVQGGNNTSLDELKCQPHLTGLEILIPRTNVLRKGLFSGKLERYTITIGKYSRGLGSHGRKWNEKTSRKLELGLGKSFSFFEDILHKTTSVKNFVFALDGGEGFPNLRHLFVHDSSCFHTVADCLESESYDPFPSLETLFLERLHNLEKIYNGQLGAKSFCLLTSIRVKNCEKLKNLFLFSSTCKALPLQEMKVCDCENMTEIFAIEREEDKIQLKELRSMNLAGLPQLTSFYSINNNEVILEETPTPFFNEKLCYDQFPAIPSCFQSLRELKVRGCYKLKYLFSSTVEFPNLERIVISDMKNLEMIWHNQHTAIPVCFKSLQELEVEKCHKLKYLFSSSTVAFPSLERIVIYRMKNLEMIWHNQLAEDSFGNLKSMEVKSCKKLLTIFQFNMLERSTKLESLMVKQCISLKVMFDLQDVNFEEFSHSVISSQLREIKIDYLPKMRHIWSKDPKGKLSLQSLKKVVTGGCRSLKNLFPASIARNLSRLEQLHISGCGVKEIVAAGEGEDLEAVTRFNFPRLTTLEFLSLSHLKCFYPSRHTAEWPALNKLRVYGCREIGSIASEENNKDAQISISVKQPLFFVKKGFLELQELHLAGILRVISQAHFSDHLFPKLKFLGIAADCSQVFQLILWRFPNLEKLELDSCSYEEILSLEEVEKHTEMSAPIKSLQLCQLEMLKHIWKKHSKLDLILQNLEFLKVSHCGLTDLLPSSASFPNLKVLQVENCLRLTNVLTSSTAESLVQLTEMKIIGCEMLTEVVANDQEDITENKFVFGKLKILELNDLSSLTDFSSENYPYEFPSLETPAVMECPKMKMYFSRLSTKPKLYCVDHAEIQVEIYKTHQ
ncbi:hypothetical protein EZV62_007004 [Acer yangbiense]|uniref:Uncharacterized protein n=1 Tax=Acer yangbiense TaxID=1000413 RepID=A0A5C7IAG1_9ROSI|nr:hypothetical protein EZV62_007004 [Acer yangbiense]